MTKTALTLLQEFKEFAESNPEWFQKLSTRQFPNNTGQDELHNWKKRAEALLSNNTIANDTKEGMAINEGRFFIAMVNALDQGSDESEKITAMIFGEEYVEIGKPASIGSGK